MPGRFGFISPGAAATDEITKILAENDAKRRQAFLDSLALKRENRNDEVQRESLASLKDQRASINEDREQKMGTAAAALLKPGQRATPAVKQALGPLAGILVAPNQQVKPEAATETPGTMDIADAFTGTPDQLKKQGDEQRQAAYIASLDPKSPEAKALQYEQMTGKQAPAGMFDKQKTLPTSAQEFEYRNSLSPEQQVAYDKSQNEDANRKRPVTNINTGDSGPMSANVEADVDAVLTGRNTLGSIRMNIGRSNQAAAYMADMRKRITKVDPTFDFIASDAGGKSVSSSYVQRATIAINGLLPNIDKFVALSNQIPRVGIHGVDSLLQKGAVQFGNQKVTSLHQMQKLIADEVGVALGAGNVSDMKLQLGFDVTDPNVPAENFAKNMDTVREFVKNRKIGLDSLRYHSPTQDAPSTPNGPTPAPGDTSETPEQRAARLRKAAGL